MTEEVPSRLSPLHDFHQSAGAKLADFGGWLMPIEYPSQNGERDGGVLAEHAAVRERVGIFDVSHLGKISILGEGAVSFLNGILTNDLDAIISSQAQYTLLLDDSGGVIDDMIAYRVSDQEVFLIPNASNSLSVYEAIAAKVPASIKVRNLHQDLAVIAVQGPSSRELLASIGIVLPANLDYMSFVSLIYEDQAITLCRTGYTGELGFELVAPVAMGYSRRLWDSLINALSDFDGRVAGLGARDTLRTEMGYALHGHELSLQINPLEAGVGWAVAMNKESFHGKEALVAVKARGLKRRLLALQSCDRTIPRTGMKVSYDGSEVGIVTSGTYSPTLKKGIALALVEAEVVKGASIEKPFVIDVRGRIGQYESIKLPFVPSHVR